MIRALRWPFYTLLIVSLTAAVRLIAHVNYLSVSLLVPALAVTFALTAIIRLAAVWVEQPRRGP